MQVKCSREGENSCNGTEIFVQDREVRDKEMFEIEGSRDREPLYL